MISHEPKGLACNKISVDVLTTNVLQRYDSRIRSKSIRVVKELQECLASADSSVLDDGIAQLIENAIAKTPAGGEVCVTLVEGPTSWELEVADSDTAGFKKWGAESTAKRRQSVGLHAVPLAERAASLHGGKLQTLPCPMGGIAKVMKIPRQG